MEPTYKVNSKQTIISVRKVLNLAPGLACQYSGLTPGRILDLMMMTALPAKHHTDYYLPFGLNSCLFVFVSEIVMVILYYFYCM